MSLIGFQESKQDLIGHLCLTNGRLVQVRIDSKLILAPATEFHL